MIRQSKYDGRSIRARINNVIYLAVLTLNLFDKMCFYTPIGFAAVKRVNNSTNSYYVGEYISI